MHGFRTLARRSNVSGRVIGSSAHDQLCGWLDLSVLYMHGHVLCLVPVVFGFACQNRAAATVSIGTRPAYGGSTLRRRRNTYIRVHRPLFGGRASFLSP
jgi:hypothetical protein